jgi:hypothetical protein
MLLVVPRPVHADGAAEARARAQHVLEDSAYQRELPGPEHLDEPKDDKKSEPAKPRDADEVAAPSASPIASSMLWVIVIVVVLLLIVFLVRELRGYESPAQVGVAAGPGEAAETTAAIVEQPLDDAEALARAGRFGEAIHALLLRTLEELMRRLDRPLPRSKTSREILAEVRLPEEARGALGHLVSAVEVSFFGGAEPGEGDYQACVERFRRFADAYTRSVRA